MTRLTRSLAAALLVATGCDLALQMPSVPVERDRTPVIASFAPASAWGGETIVLSGTNLGLPGERVRVVFTGGAESGADQDGLGDTLSVEVPPDAQDGPVRVLTSNGQADSTQALDFLGPDRLLVGAVTGTLDLGLSVSRVFEVGELGDVVVVHTEGGLLLHPDGNSTDYPRALLLLPGERPVSVEDAPEECDGPAVVVRSADLVDTELLACLDPDAGNPRLVEAVLSADGRWLTLVAKASLLWTLDLDAAAPVAVRRTPPHADLVLGAVPLDGSRFALAGRNKAWVLDAATGTSTLAVEGEVAEGRFLGISAAGSTLAILTTGGGVRLYDVATLPATRVRTLRPALPISPRDRAVHLATGGRILSVISFDQAIYFWDLTRASELPVVRLPFPEAAHLQESRRGGSFLVSAKGRFAAIDAESLREIASVPVLARLGATRLVVRNGVVLLVVARVGARDVVFVDGTDYSAKTVQVPDDIVSIAPEPDGEVVWAIGARGVWRVTRDDAEGWVEAPPDAFAAQVYWHASRRQLIAFWQFSNGVEAEWIDPARPAGQRVLGAIALSGTYFNSAYLLGDDLVTVSESVGSEDPLPMKVDVFGVDGVAEDVAPVVRGRFELTPYLGSVPLGDRVLFYEPVDDGVPMDAHLLELAGPTFEPVGPVPFIGLDVAVSRSGRSLAWLEGGGVRLQFRLVTATVDRESFARTFQGPVVPVEDGFVPSLMLPRGEAVVLVDRVRDRVQLVR